MKELAAESFAWIILIIILVLMSFSNYISGMKEHYYNRVEKLKTRQKRRLLKRKK